MRLAVVVGLVAMLSVPGAAAPTGIPPGEVIYATWTVGGRFTREEWLERATGATHRRDTGGPSCPRHIVANARWILWYGTERGVQCGGPSDLYRVRSRADGRLVDSSDLLRPQRMLRLGRAEIVGHLTVDGLAAVRVRLPSRDGTQYADLERRTRLPLRFVFLRDGAEIDAWRLRYRAKRRSSLPRDLFSPRR